MGKRGPAPDPAEKARAKNSRNKKVDTPSEKELPPVSAIPMPEFVKNDDVAVSIWNFCAKQMIGLNYIKASDAMPLARYCKMFSRWMALDEEMPRGEETYETSSKHGDMKRANPSALMMIRIEKSLENAEAKFGFNPADRQRILQSLSSGYLSAASSSGNQPSQPNQDEEKNPNDQQPGFLMN